MDSSGLKGTESSLKLT